MKKKETTGEKLDRLSKDKSSCWSEKAEKRSTNTIILKNDIINLEKLGKLLKYSDRYEISIQFWPNLTAVFISKDDIDLQDYGGDFDFAITSAIEYLDRVNKNKRI